MASLQTEQRTLDSAPGMLKIGSNSNSSATQPAANTLANESRVHDHHSSIPEEDESNETASETQEPLTPSSDTHNPQFHHHDSSVDSSAATSQPPSSVDMKPTPLITPSAMPPSSRSPEKESARLSATPTSPQKGAFSRRVGTFVKAHLHRNKSNSVHDVPHMEPSGPRSDQTQSAVEPTAPVDITPKGHRLSFSWSARNSPSTSQSNSPPSPSSPSSTINSDKPFGDPLSQRATLDSAGPRTAPRPRPGITWAGSYSRPSRISNHIRRRSASTEMVPQLKQGKSSEDGQDRPMTLYNTFSKHAEEGAGLKARRLSTSLPDEFMVDFCELDKEFKRSGFPIRPRKTVGKGATSVVLLMERRNVADDHRLYAVKQFRGRASDEEQEDYEKKVKSEYTIARSVHHPNLVETVRLCTHSGKWNHVMEYCEYGELFTLVQRGLFFTHYKYEDRMCLFKQLLRGVCYLHEHGIAHRDIKLENLLLTKEGFLKISDFGVSEVFSGEHPGLRASGGECGKNMGEVRRCAPGICGSLPYIAPEVLDKKNNYDPRPLDVWSCAIAFLTMTYGGSPWQAANSESEHYKKFKKAWDEWQEAHPDSQITDKPEGAPKCGPLFNKLDNPALKRLILKMLNPNPEKRISMPDVVSSNLIKSVECCCPEGFEGSACCNSNSIDATAKAGPRNTTKMKVQKKHNHLPPKEQHRVAKVLQHRFDMGDGWN